MRATRAAGFECGVHAWDHVKWHDQVRHASSEWTIREWTLAHQRFREVFGCSPQVAGAAGWQINETTVRMQAARGLEYVSDGRGPSPYRVLLDGQAVGPVQYPTTLPTLDEIIGREGVDMRNCPEHMLQLTKDSTPGRAAGFYASCRTGRRQMVADFRAPVWPAGVPRGLNWLICAGCISVGKAAKSAPKPCNGELCQAGPASC